MADMRLELVKSFIKTRNVDAINDYVSICHPNKQGTSIVMQEYSGDCVRVFKDKNDDVCIMHPTKMTEIQENAIGNALMTGTIYDDADKVGKTAQLVAMKLLPTTALANKGMGANMMSDITPVVGSTVGVMDEDGEVPVTDTDISNGIHLVEDLAKHHGNRVEVKNVVDNYLGGEAPLTKEMRNDQVSLKKDMDEVDSVSPEDTITSADYDNVEVEDECGDGCATKQESFISKKPKKLKAIPIRDIVSYITVEMNAIKDANDQAMLSGYTCSKLELVDFYITVIDTNDSRYIVPHDRSYLVNGQTQLNNLLSQILRIKPIDYSKRIWKADVTLPGRG